ncbi:MAG: PIN domain-containing protein [Chloroflexota bacterium]|nr:PIN domain-containing protein [Chloroflexota bacterium]
MGPGPTPHRGRVLSVYLLDTTVLIGYLRGTEEVAPALLQLLAEGHTLATSCVNLAEVERGLRPRERKRGEALMDRLRFLITDREAARRAGRYQADWSQRGRTIHTADALIAGTARTHGAVLVTHNLADFPMRDVQVESPVGSQDG